MSACTSKEAFPTRYTPSGYTRPKTPHRARCQSSIRGGSELSASQCRPHFGQYSCVGPQKMAAQHPVYQGRMAKLDQFLLPAAIALEGSALARENSPVTTRHLVGELILLSRFNIGNQFRVTRVKQNNYRLQREGTYAWWNFMSRDKH